MALEREPEPDLADALLGLLEIARVSRRTQEVRVGALVRNRAEIPATDEGGRVLVVEEVEHLANRLDARVAHQAERFRHAQVERLERRAAAAVDGLARAEVLHLAIAG